MSMPTTDMSMLAARVAAAKPVAYLLILLCSVLGALGYHLRTESIFACPASGYGSNQYLAYCQTGGYGDYDHGAFWFGLEPSAQRAAANADVLFLGNSRMQFAFSTEATQRWASSAGALFYMLGFSYGENAQFEGPLLTRLKPRASVYVINVDRFFDAGLVTSPTEAIRRSSSDAESNYDEKKRWQAFHKDICTAVPAICGHAVAFFRTRDDGTWQLKGSENFKASAVSEAPPEPVDPNDLNRSVALGQEFVSHLPVDRQCVVLTLAPWSATNTAEARAIADALKLDLVTPQLSDLRTIDGDHLDRASSERWAAAFFEAAGPRIQRCLRTGRTATK